MDPVAGRQGEKPQTTRDISLGRQPGWGGQERTKPPWHSNFGVYYSQKVEPQSQKETQPFLSMRLDCDVSNEAGMLTLG